MKIPKVKMGYVFLTYGFAIVLDIIYNTKTLPFFSALAFAFLIVWALTIGTDENMTSKEPRITLYDLNERLKNIENRLKDRGI